MLKLLYPLLICFVISRASAQPAQNSSGYSDEKIFTFVEQNPAFPGGEPALIKFIKDNLTYPEEQRKDRIQGKVLLRFIVERDGSISDIKVTRSVNPALDAEAIRVVKLFPKFQPGRQQGQAARVYYNLPVLFSL